MTQYFIRRLHVPHNEPDSARYLQTEQMAQRSAEDAKREYLQRYSITVEATHDPR